MPSTPLAARTRRELLATVNDLVDLGGASGIPLPPAPSREGGPSDEDLAAALAALDDAGRRRTVLTRQRDTAQADVNQFNAIRQHVQRWQESDRRVIEEHAAHERLTAALRIVHDERIDFTQAILDGVAADCRDLYERIHPGEPLGLMRFKLDERTRGSLHQVARFQGYDDVPPQAYFSESHLDTLGFCLFLAIARHASRDRAVIVLDDIFTSVDAQHTRRIMTLLAEECERIQQLVIATHSGMTCARSSTP
jgi:hypothetical protein